MSSWKQYGGMNKFEKAGQIDAYSITVNKLNLKEAYQGTFDICGQFIVHGDSLLDGSLHINKNMDISGNVVIGQTNSTMIVNSTSTFNGPMILTSVFDVSGDIKTTRDILVSRDVVVGRAIDFSGSSFLYSTGNALGLNTRTPTAALDISTNLPKGISLYSSNAVNENILAQNVLNRGITMGVDTSSSHIYFYYESPIGGAKPDGGIQYTPGGYLNIDVSKNVNVSCPMTISVRDNFNHLGGEVLTVNDISAGVYFGNIYQNNTAYTGVAAAFLADSSSSNVSAFMGTPGGSGLSIGGGAYPPNVTKNMGTIGLTDSVCGYVPAQMIVSGDSTSHSLTTTGINTYQPRINSYVLDINGPTHIDNGDIASIETNPAFELYSLEIASNNPNIVAALGSSIDVIKDVVNPLKPREKLIVSNNGGITWNYVDISNSAGAFSGTNVLKGNVLTKLRLYDSTNWFITGDNTMLANSYDAGITWQNIVVNNLPGTYNNIYINTTNGTISGNVLGYFSIDLSSSVVLFEIPINVAFTSPVNYKVFTTPVSNITSIKANTSALYVSGNVIAKYSALNSVVNQTPVLQWVHSYRSTYSYNNLKNYDNNYVMAVGGNIISTTTDGGTSWRDVSFNSLNGGLGVNFTSVYMADLSNAIAVGSQGNIWITNNQGLSWSRMPNNLINSSGESQRLIATTNNFRNVTMTDQNTIVITNTIQTYNYYGNVYGKSSLFTVYTPNFVNRANHMVLDISGGVRVSGDLYINDGGSFGSNNASFALLNTGVQSVLFGGDATSIIMGNRLVGNTVIRNNALINTMVVSSDATFNGNFRTNNIQIGGVANFASDISMNGQVLITNTTSSTNLNTGALVVSGGVGIGGTLNVGGISTFQRAIINNNLFLNEMNPLNNTFNIKSTGVGTVIYTIGNPGDKIILNGYKNETVQTTSNTPTFQVNTITGNATSYGAGLDIYDNSGTQIGGYAAQNVYAWMRVGQDLQSFVFKAPSYGTDDRTSTGSLYSISPENRVRIAINEMNFSTTPNVINRGLVILQPDSAFKSYQTNLNHQYTPNGLSGLDADYTINLCPDFDISNILLKNIDTDPGTQGIGTSLTIGNALLVSGATTIDGVTTIGGTASFSSNVGIGTSSPLVTLDVNGSSRFVGPLVSTNYDTLGFNSKYGANVTDILNQAPSLTYYQDAAISYDGKYQFGLLYNKTGVGSVNVSSDYGATWTQRTLPTNYSGNIIYQAVPFMSANTVTFPFSSLASNITLANAIPLNIQAGTYVASASSTFQTQNPYYIFDNSITTFWSSTSFYDVAGSYSGSTNTTDTNAIKNVNGEWFQISLPYSFILKSYQHYPPSQNFSKTIYVFGSNNGLNWYNLTITGNTINSSGNTYVSIPNNTSYNNYRFVIGNTYNATQPYVSRMDLSGIFQNVTGSFSSAMAASGSGQYITVANEGYYTGQGNLIISTDYGTTFRDLGVKDAAAVWQSVALSQTGVYQVAVSQNRSGYGNIWLSSNSGSSWATVASQRILNGWQTVSISSSGQYITAIAATTFSSPQGNIWISSNYGSSFSQPTGSPKIYNYVQNVSGFLNLGTGDFNKTVCVSSSGQYQTAVGLAPSSQISGTANIWISSNYGSNWRDTGTKPPFENGSVSVFTSITMNGSGQNQIATYMSGNIITGDYSTVSGNALISADYGSTWTNIKYSTLPVTSGLNTYYGGVTKVQSSLNGQYVFGVSKYQDISGSTYSNTTNTAFGVGDLYLSSVPVSSGMFSTQYFGSAHSGNVFQTHGLEVSVPTVNNAALLAGYDVNLDIAYINSTDKNSANPLCLQTTGGFVGIGTTSPQYPLDINGQIRANNIPCSFSFNFQDTAAWIKVGVFTGDQTGKTCIIKLYATRGYNADLAQSSITTIFFKTSNGSTTYGTTGFAGDSYHYVQGGSEPFISPPIWIANTSGTSATNYTLYLNLGAYNSSTFYTAQVSPISNCYWTPTYLFNSTPPYTTANSYCFVSVSQYVLSSSVGIGTTPAYTFDVAGTARICCGGLGTSGASMLFSGANGNFTFIDSTGSPTASVGLGFNIQGSEKMRINSGGAVGIGTTNPGYTLDVNGDIRATNSISCRYNTANGFCALNSGDTLNPGYIAFHKPGGLRVGYVGWQNTATYIALMIENGYVGYECNGIIRSVSFNATSDYRMKHNVQILDSTSSIDLLRPVEYDLSGGKHDMGFLAHEVQEVFPFLVEGEKDGKDMQSLNYNGFIALLVKEVQDLKKENRELKERMDKLEQRFM